MADRQLTAAPPALRDQIIAELDRLVRASYAHNSKLYHHLETTASLAEITQFLRWDAVQPPFNLFLRLWLDKVPPCLVKPLADHIHEEEVEEHSRLFCEVLEHLNAKVPGPTALNQERLEALNYTFSKKCAEEQHYGFFLGSFFATEIMSAKRCRQIQNGLLRNGIEQGRLVYFKIHCDHDESHAKEIVDRFMIPVLELEPPVISVINEGIKDRLHRSGEYLQWYKHEYL